MSWIPLRDSFDLMPETQGDIVTLSEKIDAEARSELHRDSCGCDGGYEACKYGTGYISDAPSEFVIAWMLRAGMVRADRIKIEAEL